MPVGTESGVGQPDDTVGRCCDGSMGHVVTGVDRIGYRRHVSSVDPLSPEERRVIGALIEKGATTPDSYPLSTNALRLACNQSTSRDPVVDYTDRQIDALMLQLRQRGLARTVSGAGHRVGKHRHVAGEALCLSAPELAVLAVMLLRGPQTVAGLASRTSRYADGPEGLDGVNAAIDALVGRDEPMARRLATRPGEREPRVEQIWSPVESTEGDAALPVGSTHGATVVTAAMVERAESTEGDTALPVGGASDSETTGADERPVAEPDGNPASGEPSSRSDLADRVVALERALAEQTARLDSLVARFGD